MTEDFIRKIRRDIDGEISYFLDRKKRESRIKDAPAEFLEIIDDVRKFMLRGGKRLRPVLFFYGCGALNDNDDYEDILKICILVEFMHIYLLIHDDIIDQDDLRHGGMSLHAEYRKRCNERLLNMNPEHFGVSMAINVGDIVSVWVYEIIMESNLNGEKKNRLVRKVSEVIEDTLIGQVLDQSLEAGSDFSEESILRVQEYKTAKYTIQGPLQMGAILTGAGEDDLSFISAFSVPLGVAYQIKDDIIGLFGEEEKIGKPVGSDIKEGKKTLLISYALKKAGDDERKFLLSQLGNQNLTVDDLERIRKIVKESGSLDYSNGKIESLRQCFIENLKSDHELYEKYSFMENLSNLLLKREN